MIWLIVKAVISAAIIVIVSEISNRSPRLGAFVLTLPIVSILALCTTWFRNHDLKVTSQLARETLILVPLGLPFFVPLAFADRLGIGFVTAMLAGLLMAGFTIGAWLIWG